MAPKSTRRAFLAASAAAASFAQTRRPVYVVPNFHPASCGWLTNFSMERVYCANSYFDHLDRVRDDSNYSFALSECNNLIAMLNFKPERKAELQRAIRAGRVELVNAFFLESTINLSGGEALVRLGVEGLRWQQHVFGVRPRFAWCIDVCGTHPQMAQITKGLGLDAFVYCRRNNTGSAIHWFEGPDGTRVLAIAPGHYSDFGPLFDATAALTQEQTAELRKMIEARKKITPEGAPVLALGGYRDYNLAPRRRENPSAFLNEWQGPEDIRFTTLSKYVDAVMPGVKSGAIKIPTMRGATGYSFLSFWIQNPRVKTAFRRCEHQLQAAEMLATAVSLKGAAYPSEALYHAWLQMFLNMDRNTLWGAAGGMVFEHETSWDAADRFRGVERATAAILKQPGSPALFNALNWKRRDPVVVDIAPAGTVAEATAEGRAICLPELAPLSVAPAIAVKAEAPKTIDPPSTIENKFYVLRFDLKTGCIVSLKLKPSGRELLGGPANLLIAERPQKQSGDPGDHMLPREQRDRLATSSAVRATATRGPVATTVVFESSFYGACRRQLRLYHDSPRIDFETTLNDIPDRTVIVSEFPLAAPVTQVRRGVPYGFIHTNWPEPTEAGITPAVRWSHYQTAAGSLAIFDRGLSGRELTGNTPVIFLLNTTNKYYGYPNAWLSGDGRHVLEYAIVAHEGSFRSARIPQAAWEYNSPPYATAGTLAPILETSDNVIVESIRRTGNAVEVRLVECFGEAGTASVKVALPHRSASITNMTGGDPRPLKGSTFPVRPQQIVTLRFETATAVDDPKPLMEWDALVPEHKRPMLRRYSSEKGHPPRGV